MDTAAQSPNPEPAVVAGDTLRVVRQAPLNRWAGGLLALGCVTLVVIYFNNLWTKEYYQFYPLAFAAVAYLGWSRWKEVPQPLEQGAPWVTVGLLGMAFLVLAGATFLMSGWVGMIGALLLAVATIWWLGGWPLTRKMIPAALMMLTVMRPPFNLDGRLVMKLQALSTQWSSAILDAASVTHAISGNVIEIPGQKLMVEEACSGINSILSTTTVCLFYCLWRRRNIVHTLILLAMTVGFVLLGNVSRIVSGAWLRSEYRVDILSGWKHETIGLVLFALYLGLILSGDKLLFFFLGPGKNQRSRRDGNVPPGQPEVLLPPAPGPVRVVKPPVKWGYAVGGAFALLGLAQLGLSAREWRQHAGINLAGTVTPASSFNLPNELAGWQRIEMGSNAPALIETRGIQSRSWHYRRGNQVAVIALDYPISGYHDVTLCYTGNGWDIVNSTIRPAAESPDQIPSMEVKLQKQMLMRGILNFSTMDEKGRWLEGSFTGRNFMERFRDKTSSNTYRIQALSTSYLPPTAETEQALTDLFRAARLQLAGQLNSALKQP